MGMDLGKSLALTAATGLVAGLYACAGSQEQPKDPAATSGDAPPAGSAEAKAPNAECCKGKNECEGKGNCAVPGSHSCAGQNKCKGKGGCTPKDCKK
jgi:hypothetical protein